MHLPEVRVRRSRAIAIAIALVTVAPAGAEKNRPGGPATPAPAIEDEIVRHMALSQPGREHRQLDPLVGSWSVDLLWRGAGGIETRARGTSENRWILDGRFLLCDSTAGEGPSRIDATTVYGFDSQQDGYFALSLHNLATSVLQLSGSFDRATQSFLLSGKQRDEVTGTVLVRRQLLKIEGPDRYVVRVYFDVAGRAPVRVVEAVFTRR